MVCMCWHFYLFTYLLSSNDVDDNNNNIFVTLISISINCSTLMDISSSKVCVLLLSIPFLEAKDVSLL